MKSYNHHLLPQSPMMAVQSGLARELLAPLASEITIIVPTYNEEANLAPLLAQIANALPGASVLLADDDSRDGTREVARAFCGPLSVEILHRRDPGDRGLTASVADAILRARTKHVVVMDADLQHPPALLPDLAAALEEGADVAVASRIDDASFSLRRRTVSRAARFLAGRHLARRAGVALRDPMSGFFAMRADVAQDVVRRHAASFERSGFKVLMDVLLHAPRGLRVAEVPYVFESRYAGESKLTRRHYVSFLRQLGTAGRAAASLLDLIFTGVLFRFAAVGLSGVLVNLLLLMGLHEGMAVPVTLAAPFAIEASVLWNFAWNERWTFRGRGGGSLVSRCWRFHVASVVGMAVQYGVVAGAALWLPHVSYLWAALAGIALGSFGNFLLNLKWTWGVDVEAGDAPP